VSALTPPDRLGPLLATPPGRRREEFLATLAALMGDEALHPLLHAERLWATDPFTRGYVTAWWPGDVMAVGPLHGTHEPPFYVCGSDQWVAGYMEGAVRTGRDAASQALGLGPREFLAVGSP
jgi:monoamine oxidase